MFKKYSDPKTFLPLILIVIPLIVYWITKPPSILWIDSGTMIGASYTLGIPNPPGFPFYMLASHIFAILPFANVLVRLELFTIFFSILTIHLVYRIILLLISSDFFFSKNANLNEDLQIITQPNRNLKYFASAFGAITLAFSYQYFSQSQNTEAFIFTDFFLCLFIYILLFIQAKKKLFMLQKNGREIFSKYLFKGLLLLSFLYGLAAGANPTIAALIPGVLFIMYLNRRSISIKQLIVLGAVFSITLSLVYSYLPIRASAWPFVNWGNPQTLSLFIGQLRGEGLNIFEPESGSINGFTGSPVIFLQSVSHFFYLLLIQFTPLLLPFIYMGGRFVYKKNKQIFWFLFSVIFVDVFYAGLYFSGNQESWFILSWIICAIFIGIGFYFTVLKLSLKVSFRNALFLLCFLPLLVWFIPLNRSQHYYSDDYAKNLYSSLSKDAILIGTGDFSNSLGFYLHEADKYRPDVTPVTANVLYVNKWYRDGLRHASNIVVSPKLEDIIQYKAFDEYNRAMNSFIADNIDKHPVYVTHLTLRASALAATSAGQLVLDNRFKFIPHGLSLQVVPSNSNAKPDPKAFDFVFNTPNPQKPPFYIERNYNSGYKNLANDYAYSWEALGDWYSSSGEYDRALVYYKKADSWSPNNPEILSRFGQYYGVKKELDVARQYFQKALDLSPNSFSTRFNLAVTLANMGRIDEAVRQYNIIQEYAQGSSIALDAESQIKSLSSSIKMPEVATSDKALGNTFVNQEDNYSFQYPAQWSVVKNSQGLVNATNNKIGKQALDLVFYGKKITKPQGIDDFVKTGPLRQPGTLLDIQNINVPGFKAFLQVWGQSGVSSQVVVITNDIWAWQITVSPGDSTNMNDLYKILNTFKSLR
jgi:tetratricopeptide (TPR) repeat protein